MSQFLLLSRMFEAQVYQVSTFPVDASHACMNQVNDFLGLFESITLIFKEYSGLNCSLHTTIDLQKNHVLWV